MTSAPARFRALVLDFDGVVLESVDIKTEAFREIFGDHPRVDAIIAYHVENNGISRFLKFEHIYRHFLGRPYGEKEKAEVSERFSAVVFRRLLECPFVPGAEELLESVCRLRVPVYVASASPHEELHRILEERGLKRYFVDAFGHPTRKDEVVRLVRERHGLASGEILYVGDSLEDFRAARSEGVFFVGRRNREPLDGLAAPVFDDLEGVARWLSSEGGLPGA
jgi:phosphoglycolate phosphatase-like HAD superfamily hydrolase